MKVKNQMTESEIVNDIYSSFTAEDVRTLLSYKTRSALGALHHHLGRQIRNVYGLWSTSPITEAWRNDEGSRAIKDGIDCSDDHPDAVSMRVIEALWARVVRDDALKQAIAS